MVAKVDSPEPEFPLPSSKCLFCKEEGVKGGGVGYVICDLFRFELMQYKTVQFEDYSMCFKCGSVINYLVYIKRLLLTTMFDLPVEPPIFTRELPEIAKFLNENVRYILNSNILQTAESPIPTNIQLSSIRKNGSKSSPYLRIQDLHGQDDLQEDTEPLLVETCSTFEEPANIGYHRYNDERVRAQSEPRTRSRAGSVSKRPKSQLSRPRTKSQAKQHVCKWLNCRLVCQSQRKLAIHYEDEHGFDCLICNQCSFESRRYLEKHKKENHDRKCKLCKTGIKPNEFRDHCREPHNFQCPYCDLKFHKYKHLSAHSRTKHEKRPILELYFSEKSNRNLTEENTISHTYEETEIIILNRNDIQQQAQTLELEETLSVIESTTDVNDALSLNGDNVAKEIDVELHRTDSGIDIEQERPQSVEVEFTTVNISTSVPEEITDKTDDNENLAAPISIETSVTDNARLEAILTDSPALSPEPPVLIHYEASDSAPIDSSSQPSVLSKESAIPSVASSEIESDNQLNVKTRTSKRQRLKSVFFDDTVVPNISVAIVSPTPTVLSDSALASPKSHTSDDSQSTVKTRSSKRRRLKSVLCDDPPVPEIATVPEITLPTIPEITITPINTVDEVTNPNQEESHGSLDVEPPDQTLPDSKSVRSSKKRAALMVDGVKESVKPIIFSLMNTRSRGRSQKIKAPTPDTEITLQLKTQDGEEETSVKHSKKAKYDEDNVSRTSQAIDEKSERSKDKDEANDRINDEVVPKKSSKRSGNQNSVHSNDTVNIKSAVISVVDKNVTVNVSKEPVDAFLKKRKRNYDGTSASKNTTETNKVKDKVDQITDENNMLLTIDTNETSQSIPALIEIKPSKMLKKSIDNTASEELKNKIEGIYNLPGFYTEVNSDILPEQVAEVKTANTLEPYDIFDHNIGHILKLGEKDINSSERPQTVVVQRITDAHLEDHESNDSASSCTSLTIIHEEDFSFEEDATQSKTETSESPSNINAVKPLSNMDDIIEAVVKATDVLSKSKSLAKKLSKTKSAKLELSPIKLIKSAGNKIPVGKLAKVLAKSNKPSNNTTSSRKKALEETSTAEVTTYDMNSLAKYMMSKLDREKSTSKSSIPDDNLPLSIYKKASPSKTALRIDTIDSAEIAFTPFQKPSLKKTPDFTFTNEPVSKIVDSLSKIKQKSVTIKKRGRNKKERSDRRAINFDEFIADRDTSSIATEKPETESQSNDRIPKPDEYAFPETDTTRDSFSTQEKQVDLNIDTRKKSSNSKQKIDSTEPPVKKKSRVKSKPRKNTGFDNIITQASQKYYKK